MNHNYAGTRATGLTLLIRDIKKKKLKLKLQWHAERQLLHLTDNLAGPRQTLHHLLALFPSADCVVAFLEQVVEFLVTVHVLEKLALHLILSKSSGYSQHVVQKMRNGTVRTGRECT